MFEELITNVLIGASLAVDAFAVTVGEGMSAKKRKFGDILIQAIYFGVFQAAMPIIGFYLAGTVSGKIMSLGPYISFLMLAFIGGKMLYDSIKRKPDEQKSNEKSESLSHSKTLLLALATSIDALAVGVSFAFTESRVFLPSSIIGVTTFIICLAGGLLCSKLPRGSGKKAGIVGGAVLIGIGLKLLLEGIL